VIDFAWELQAQAFEIQASGHDPSPYLGLGVVMFGVQNFRGTKVINIVRNITAKSQGKAIVFISNYQK
jgi:hypothetical protein